MSGDGDILVVCFQRLEPFGSGGDDFVRIGALSEGFAIGLCSSMKRLMAAWSSAIEQKTPLCKRRRESLAHKRSTAFSQELDVGVKWKVQRGHRASMRRTSGVLRAELAGERVREGERVGFYEIRANRQGPLRSHVTSARWDGALLAIGRSSNC